MIKQRWECPECHFIYESVLHVQSVTCPTTHPGRTRAMQLIEGEPAREHKKKAKP